MLKTLKNAWGIEELRKKILFTLFIILVYRLGNAVPVPYVNTAMLESYFNTVNNTILGLWNTMSGGSFSMATIFALSIQPYINASIIIQLLTIAIPALERLQKEGGEEGRKKLASITRYTTVGIGLIMGFAYYMLIKNGVNGQSMLTADGAGVWPAIVKLLTYRISIHPEGNWSRSDTEEMGSVHRKHHTYLQIHRDIPDIPVCPPECFHLVLSLLLRYER